METFYYANGNILHVPKKAPRIQQYAHLNCSKNAKLIIQLMMEQDLRDYNKALLHFQRLYSDKGHAPIERIKPFFDDALQELTDLNLFCHVGKYVSRIVQKERKEE